MTPLVVAGWTCLATGILGAVYTYAGYPLYLALRRSTRSGHQGVTPESPAVRVLVPAHNEAGEIGRKLDNLLEETRGLAAEIVVIDDGSTDATAEIVESHADRGVRLLRLKYCRGKNAALNEAMRRLAPHPPLVATTDADAVLAPGCLRKLLTAVSAPDIGMAAARVVYAEGGGAAREQRYFGYENLVRRLESKSGACVSLGGQLEIHRAQIWRDLPENVATDMATALLARAAGLGAVQVHDAVVFTGATGRVDRELGRKRRTIRRALAAVAWLWPELSADDRLRVLSHKVFRYMLPAYQGLVLAGSALLALGRHMLGVPLLYAQLALYALVLTAFFGGLPARLRSLAYYQAVHLIGFGEVLRRLGGPVPSATWSRAR